MPPKARHIERWLPRRKRRLGKRSSCCGRKRGPKREALSIRPTVSRRIKPIRRLRKADGQRGASHVVLDESRGVQSKAPSCAALLGRRAAARKSRSGGPALCDAGGRSGTRYWVEAYPGVPLINYYRK